jgi:hypothetical protein
MMAGINELTQGSGIAFTYFFLVIAIILTVLWILVPFILLDIRKSSRAGVEELQRAADANENVLKGMETVTKQLDWLIKAKTAERQGQKSQKPAAP